MVRGIPGESEIAMNAVPFIIIGACAMSGFIGLVVGYLVGWDIGYAQRIEDCISEGSESCENP